MSDLADLTPEHFEPLVGDCFERPIDGQDDGVELRLTSVDRGRVGPERTAFSLLFSGAASPLLEPDVHPLVHPDLGRIEVFISPVMDRTAPAGSVTYEVIFG